MMGTLTWNTEDCDLRLLFCFVQYCFVFNSCTPLVIIYDESDCVFCWLFLRWWQMLTRPDSMYISLANTKIVNSFPWSPGHGRNCLGIVSYVQLEIAPQPTTNLKSHRTIQVVHTLCQTSKFWGDKTYSTYFNCHMFKCHMFKCHMFKCQIYKCLPNNKIIPILEFDFNERVINMSDYTVQLGYQHLYVRSIWNTFFI